MNDSELDLLLREMREEELPAGALAAVRAGVRERIHARRRWWFAAWFWAPAAVAVAALVVAVFVPRVRPVHGLEVALRSPAVPEFAFRRAAAPAMKRENAGVSPHAHRGNSAKPRSAQGENKVMARSGEPQEERTEFIKMYTDDPDVVILWAMNSKGETR
ncbi:MAG: hypothetical protein ABSC08_16600 [Bryobacteraceae bacterium]|jgi:hypothetical protein